MHLHEFITSLAPGQGLVMLEKSGIDDAAKAIPMAADSWGHPQWLVAGKNGSTSILTMWKDDGGGAYWTRTASNTFVAGAKLNSGPSFAGGYSGTSGSTSEGTWSPLTNSSHSTTPSETTGKGDPPRLDLIGGSAKANLVEVDMGGGRVEPDGSYVTLDHGIDVLGAYLNGKASVGMEGFEAKVSAGGHLASVTGGVEGGGAVDFVGPGVSQVRVGVEASAQLGAGASGSAVFGAEKLELKGKLTAGVGFGAGVKAEHHSIFKESSGQTRATDLSSLLERIRTGVASLRANIP